MDLKEFAKLSDRDLKQLGKRLALKNYQGDLNRIAELAKQHLAAVAELDSVRAEHNRATKERDIEAGKVLSAKVGESEQRLKDVDIELMALWRGIPNPPAKGAPEGGEEDSKVIGHSRLQPKALEQPKDHVALGAALNIIDIERGVKVAGSRSYYLKNEAAELEFALVRWIFRLLKKKGFELMVGPQLLSREVMSAAGYLDENSKEVYRVANLPTMVDNHHQCPHCEAWTTVPTEDDYICIDNHGTNELLVECSNQQCKKKFSGKVVSGSLYLNGTSEQSILGFHTDEIIEAPKRYAAFSTCFRKEAGSYGKDVKGIIRTHQFDKIEMFSFVEPKESEREHKRLVAIQEFILKKLEIPYQKVLIAAGDLGMPAARKIDLESWIPSQQRYRETHSCSNCTDWQSRRAMIRYRIPDGKTDYVYTLNGTAVAIGRMLVAILENHQQKDGSIRIPRVLWPYCGFREIKVRD